MNRKNNKDVCKVHVLPSFISDEDINALFAGLLNVVKKKIGLDTNSRFLALTISFEKLKRDFAEKSKECEDLRNQIVRLQSNQL